MLQGGCLCGTLRYAAEGKPFNASFCHCRTCQLAAGAPVLAWVTFPTAGFRWTAGQPTTFASSPGVARAFCARCGTTLTWAAEKSPAQIDITTATLDTPEVSPPEDHIWVRSRLPWMRGEDGLPEYRERRV